MSKSNSNLISQRITHTYISGKTSCTLVIPINVARKYGLDKPTDVIIEELNDGVLVKKFNLANRGIEEKKNQEQEFCN